MTVLLGEVALAYRAGYGKGFFVGALCGAVAVAAAVLIWVGT